MNDGKEKQLRYYTEFKIVKDTIQKLNPEFSLCTILVAYHGDNRNRSSISKEVFNDCLWSIYGIPIVGEWVKVEDDQSKETWGSHGGRLIWDSEGLKYEQTTRPFGFVTEEAYKNASWVEILEKDGHTKHEYLRLERCILWTERYEECESILEENYGQSMEIRISDDALRNDGYTDIKKFIFSALCILGTEHPPCFESAMIGRQYELDQFKQEMRAMMDNYKLFSAQQNNKKEEEGMQDLPEINFSDVCDKIKYQMNENVYQDATTNKKYAKYIVLFVNEQDSSVVVVDREDKRSAYCVPYMASQTTEGLVVTLDFENKKNWMVGAVESTDAVFDVTSEVELFAKDTSDFNVGAFSSQRTNELMTKVEELESKCSDYEVTVEKLTKQLGIYETQQKAHEIDKHKSIIDAIVASKREEMGKYSEFMEYCQDPAVLYAKTEDAVRAELKDIHYNFMVKSKPNNKATFAAIETGIPQDMNLDQALVERYGEDIAKAIKARANK